MGVLNATPDSFSDGGKFNRLDLALKHIDSMVENGADISSVQQMLGHSSITTTEKYLHMGKKHLKQTLEKFHPRS